MTSRLQIAMLLATMIFFTGCVQQGPSEDYSGALARFEATSKSRGSHGGDYFFLSEVNGQKPSMTAAASTVNARGDVVTEVTFVPAKLGTYTIVGSTQYNPPIYQLINKIYRISGTISFIPEPNKTYIIKGELDDQHSAVWIEKSDTGALIDKRIEIAGSTAVGFMEK